ncbi:sigma-54 dependent transcriptional regulator [Psychrosphaera sp. B3R10]|uniref:Sigma-54 dependent transcriptional regulator n=1 Tax=Psychrosphaera algicola TaxID=3023714 RepID=A0ABT5FFD3_9GAMM|nr:MULTISPECIES: sigma-54 dependent transcriptional regulator [unclassified Psychrosphaera]MBU2882756.1 sigma-54 dependent transcriptional regulator [Psychrosphaera sp. I2R16]MBU2989226.1 sigma-54 dependent transcriptional regulator [Psychrosphaera sp. B3R10]MDC2889652.1 sigma-54 dependent transcriptional regulator [Psychrosphaera sp. G1-22]
MDKILIVDDTPAVLQALSLLLEIHGYDVITTTSPVQALQYANQLRVSLVIQDMNFTGDTTSGDEGKELFYQLRHLDPHLPVILITAWTDLEQAIELVKAGAVDYIAKPWDDQKLLNTIVNLVALGKANQASEKLQRQQAITESTKSIANNVGLVYASPAMQRVVDMAVQVAKSDISVLITGANGSGKEKIAEVVQANSLIPDAPFIKVNCGALPADLIEAELFGAEAGAYTGANKKRIGLFEAADGGTLFLDEIGNLPYSGQTKLLRVIQTGEFQRLGSVNTIKTNVRVISATNSNLLDAIATGEFREDLFYRLNVIELHVPSLANRVDDIMPLVHHFLPNRELSLSAENALKSHLWQGNVRELENGCKRVAVLKPIGVIEAEDFALSEQVNNRLEPTVAKQANAGPTKQQLEIAMREHKGVIARVARHFNLSRQALYRRLDKFEIPY